MECIVTVAPGIDGRPCTVIVLAAGEGKRMRSALPKVLHPLLGRTMLGHVLEAVRGVLDGHTVVVVGRGADQVRAHLGEIAPKVQTVLQAEQRGTGHAVRVALAALDGAAGPAGPAGAAVGAGPAGSAKGGLLAGSVVVLNGDIPLLREETLRALIAGHEAAGVAATVLTARVPNPSGLGRIVRAEDGRLLGIVEERDATAEQRAITEINAGAYVFDAATLRATLGKLPTDNDQGEEYLTDVFGLLVAAGQPVAAHCAEDSTETLGANDRAELASLRALLRDRINRRWLLFGATIIDPATTWIDVTVSIERDAVIEPNTHLRGATHVSEGATVGPDTTIIDSTIGAGATVVRAHAIGAKIGPAALVGPFAYLRPGTRLARKAKIGTFVEAKAADVGEGAKVPHLTYVGDATIGAGTNIGAATVFVNYDGVNKFHTEVGAHARTGADNMFVAPVTIGDGAYTAAGSVITEDVPPGAMAVARGRQRNIEGWVERRRPGTAAAEAARRAGTATSTVAGSTVAESGVVGPGVDKAAPGVGAEVGNRNDGSGSPSVSPELA